MWYIKREGERKAIPQRSAQNTEIGFSDSVMDENIWQSIAWV